MLCHSFLRLGDLRITLQNVKRRLDAIVFSDLTVSHSSTPSKVETALDMLVNNLQVEFTNVLENVMVLLDGLDPGPYKELALRRTLVFIETFAELADIPLKLDNTQSTRIRKCHYTVLNMLILTYEAQADFPEVEHFTQQLEVLPWDMKSSNSETTNLLAKSLTRTSRRMRDVLKSLAVPPKYSSSLHLTSEDPFPPIHRAMLDRNERVIRALYETTEQALEQEDILRRGVLHVAAETSNVEILGLLTSKTQGLMKNRDLCWTTPLCLAAYNGDYEFFTKMVELCDPLDLEVRDGEGQSIMTIACAAGHTRIVEVLLANNISPNGDAPLHCSPLDAAASAGHSDICRTLLDHGAWVDWFNGENKTAAQSAEQHGHGQIALMIEDYYRRPQNHWSLHLQQNLPSSHAPTAASSPMSVPCPFTPLQSTSGLCPPSPSYLQPSKTTDDHMTSSASPGIQIYIVDDNGWESQYLYS
jgi:ankyrin repeat protein